MKKLFLLSMFFGFLIIMIGVVISLIGAAVDLTKDLEGFAVRELAWGLSALAIYVMYVRFIRPDTPPGVALNKASIYFFSIGLVIGVATFFVGFSLLLLFGGTARFSVTPEALFVTLAAATGIAILEEVIFRGLLFHLLGRLLPMSVAIFTISIFFTIAHLDGRSDLALASTLLLGLAFTIAAAQYKNLWAPIGLHIGVGFFTILASGIPGVHSGFVKFTGSQFRLELTFLIATALLVIGMSIVCLVSWLRHREIEPESVQLQK
jgi:uncharacterized protein